MQSNNKKKIINDPVHGFINIPSEIIFDLIQHKNFQRLRRIKQLGLSDMVYPSATHSRFSHSLGAMFLMYQALDTLKQKGEEISQEEIQNSLIAILLHDIGHSPFSHCLEDFFFTNPHEEISLALMKRMNVPKMAIDIFSNTYKKRFLHQLVSSQVDMDRLDYLTRDSFFTGVTEGVVGTQRIIKMLAVFNDELVIEQKGIYSIEKFILSRRLMYWQVYMHKTAVSADILLKTILKRARQLSKEGKKVTENISKYLSFFIENDFLDINNEIALEYFTLLDDFDIINAVKSWTENKDFILSYLSSCLLKRHLGKMQVQSSVFDNKIIEEEIENFVKKNSKISLTKEEVENYFIITDQLKNKTYNFNDDKINILLKNGEVKEIFNASDQLDKDFLGKEIKKYFLYKLSIY
ncbi:MAG: HD domain-containing protein [Bacteroidales bacterium]|jgi:HD superfamily phosphohydrolase|nr:HD domain-containing protein [Bacteroidales bacterium]